jgi:hypothetical protein
MVFNEFCLGKPGGSRSFCAAPALGGLLAQTFENFVIAFGTMRARAAGAVLDSVGYSKIAAAVLQQIQRAKAKQAVETLGLGLAMAGKISAGWIRKKTMAVLHDLLLVRSECDLQLVTVS